jgi:hypothetical protein
MFDEMDRLRQEERLADLLRHYADLADDDREEWQDRLSHLDGVDPRGLARLHGELLAYGWVEQNTGLTLAGPAGTAARCYRITPTGLRALRQVPDEEGEAA